MSDQEAADIRTVYKPGHWAHGMRAEVVAVGQATQIGSRSPAVLVSFPDSLGSGQVLFEASELVAIPDPDNGR